MALTEIVEEPGQENGVSVQLADRWLCSYSSENGVSMQPADRFICSYSSGERGRTGSGCNCLTDDDSGCRHSTSAQAF
jgi:hypothetical protein